MQAVCLEGGFANAPIEASHAFRAIMTAMARPGQINMVMGATPPPPLSVAAGVALLTLCDPETPIFLAGGYNVPQVCDWVTFHTGAPMAAAENAMFAVGTWDELPLTEFQLGTAQYPDRSATLMVEIPVLSNEGTTLRGPGIADQIALSLPEIAAFHTNAQHFPRGLDFIFTCGNRLAALPRTTRVAATEET